METKKLVAFVVVLIVVIGVAVFLSKRFGATDMPEGTQGEMVKRVDVTDGKVIERTVKQWESLGTKGGKYKNPDSGDYTMVRPITCASCGELIAPAQMPPNPTAVRTGPVDPRQEARAFAEWQAECQRVTQEHVCPKCGGLAVGDQSRGR